MKIYIAVQEMNEGYDATVTLNIKVFATEALAKGWCDELKGEDPNYMWRDYEESELIGV